MITGLEVPFTNFDVPFEVVAIGVITGLATTFVFQDIFLVRLP
jgi:hypothetical protein